MARIRTIKPEFWEDETIGLLSPPARLLFIASWNLADDEGLLRWAPAYLKGSVFVYDDISIAKVAAHMTEVAEAGLVYPYKGGKAKQELAYIVNFRKHQRINRPQPGKLPPPSIQNPAVARMYAERDDWTCHLCNGEIEQQPGSDERFKLSLDHLTPRSQGGSDYPSNIRAAHCSCNKSRRDKPLLTPQAPPGAVSQDVNAGVNDSVNEAVNHSPQEGKGMEGNGEEGNARGANTLPPPATQPPTPLPASWAPTADHAVYAKTHRLDLQRETSKYRNRRRSEGRTSSDWNADFQGWLERGADYAAKNGNAPAAQPGDFEPSCIRTEICTPDSHKLTWPCALTPAQAQAR